MYETIHSLIVDNGKGGAREIPPGQPYTCDPKEAERLLRIGAIRAVSGGKPEPQVARSHKRKARTPEPSAVSLAPSPIEGEPIPADPSDDFNDA